MKKQYVILVIVLIICVTSYIQCERINMRLIEENRVELIGSYLIDLDKTDLGLYSKNITTYKNLKFFLNGDSTFRLNMDVPFIYDSSGTWLPAGSGLEDWNHLYFQKNKSFDTQFSSFWSADSIIYLNSTTAKERRHNIGRIYFKKIGSK